MAWQPQARDIFGRAPHRFLPWASDLLLCLQVRVLDQHDERIVVAAVMPTPTETVGSVTASGQDFLSLTGILTPRSVSCRGLQVGVVLYALTSR